MAKRPDPIELGPLTASTMDRQKGERWYWRARRKDTREVVWTGWATRDEASVELGALVAKGLPSSKRDDPRDVRTVGDLLDMWDRHERARADAGRIAPLTLGQYRRSAGYWKEAVGDISIHRLTRAIVEDTLTQWQAEGVSPRTAKNALKALRMALGWGVKRDLCQELDLSRAASVKVRADEHVYCDYTPTVGEVAATIERCPDGPIGDAIRLLAITGARVSEVCALRRRDYSDETGDLVLCGRDTERSRRGKVGVRRFPLPPEGRQLLRRLSAGRGPDEPLFSLPRNAPDKINRALTEICEAAEIPRYTPHGLRRYVVMRLLEVVDAKTVSVLTGHSVQQLLSDYVRPTSGSLRTAVLRAGLGPVAAGEGATILDFGSGTASGNNGKKGRS